MGVKNKEQESYYRSLTRKMVFMIILVSVTPSLVIMGIILYYFENSYRQKALDYLTVLVKKHGNHIDNFVSNSLANISVLARTSGFERLSQQEYLEESLRILQTEYGRSFADLGVVNQDGVQICYAGPYRLKGADYSEAAWFKQALNADYYVSDVFQGLRGFPHFIVAVRHVHQGRTWILRATVDFEEFNRLVTNIRIGSTGFAFILNEDGELQTKLDDNTMSSKKYYLAFLRDSSAPLDKIRVAESLDSQGTDFVHVKSRIKDGDWLLAYQQKEDDAFSVIYHVQQIALIVFSAGTLGMVVLAIGLSRRMVSHISEADGQKEILTEQLIETGKLASIGELAAGVAHEINNPVAIMVEEAGWMGDLLEDEKKAEELENIGEFRRSLDQIRVQGKRCKEITQKLLSFARKTDTATETVQLNDLVEEAISVSLQRAKYSNVNLEASLDPDLPEVTVSPSEVQQVLLNLINNGIDALGQNGGAIRVVTSVADSKVTIDVADDGPGISKANIQRIFDPFFTTKPPGKGTGLGLSICYGAVQKMGGQLSVNSAIGVGTTFHIQIPLTGV
jgi:two-component system NtrC family sensor kinase